MGKNKKIGRKLDMKIKTNSTAGKSEPPCAERLTLSAAPEIRETVETTVSEIRRRLGKYGCLQCVFPLGIEMLARELALWTQCEAGLAEAVKNSEYAGAGILSKLCARYAKSVKRGWKQVLHEVERYSPVRIDSKDASAEVALKGLIPTRIRE
jgi:hypothetical protein